MFTVIGNCIGVAPLTRGSGEKEFTQMLLGVSVPKLDDPFGGTEVQHIVIGEKLFNEKLKAELNKQKGNEIQVEVNPTHKVWRGNVQTTLYFVNQLPSPNYVKSSQ